MCRSDHLPLRRTVVLLWILMALPACGDQSPSQERTPSGARPLFLDADVPETCQGTIFESALDVAMAEEPYEVRLIFPAPPELDALPPWPKVAVADLDGRVIASWETWVGDTFLLRDHTLYYATLGGDTGMHGPLRVHAIKLLKDGVEMWSAEVDLPDPPAMRLATRRHRAKLTLEPPDQLSLMVFVVGEGVRSYRLDRKTGAIIEGP